MVALRLGVAVVALRLVAPTMRWVLEEPIVFIPLRLALPLAFLFEFPLREVDPEDPSDPDWRETCLVAFAMGQVS